MMLRFAILLLALVLPVFGDTDALLQELAGRKGAALVYDLAGVIAGDGRAALESRLQELERATGAEVAVLTLNSLEGGQIDDFANRIFEAWGIGKKGRDNGVLFLVVVQDRKVKIEVGYGLEAILPDGKVGRVLDQSVMPEFRQGQIGAGVIGGATAIARIIADDAGVTLRGLRQEQPGAVRRQGSGLWSFIVMVAFVLLFIRNPFLALLLLSGGRGGGFGGGGFGRGGGGGFGGFGGGLSGGGGAGRSW